MAVLFIFIHSLNGNMSAKIAAIAKPDNNKISPAECVHSMHMRSIRAKASWIARGNTNPRNLSIHSLIILFKRSNRSEQRFTLAVYIQVQEPSSSNRYIPLAFLLFCASYSINADYLTIIQFGFRLFRSLLCINRNW